MKALNLIGQRFGRLIVLERTENNKWGKSQWFCRCDCGKHIKVIARYLVGKDTRSCGCLNRDVSKTRIKEKSPNWKGDKAGHIALHKWLRKHKIKPSLCERCGLKLPLELSFNKHPKPYTRNVDDYEYLCTCCHSKKDRPTRFCPKLSPYKVNRIRQFYSVNAGTIKELSKIFHVSKGTISNVIQQKNAYK